MKCVVGFLFDPDNQVLLQLQREGKPYTGGKLNGMGGKVEIGETPNGAMRREACEEANLVLPGDMRWQQFHYERHASGTELYFYTAMLGFQMQPHMFDPPQGDMNKRVTLAEEPLFILDAEKVCFEEQRFPIVPNLVYLIPMALHWLYMPSERYLEG